MMNSSVIINDGGQNTIVAQWYDERSETRTDPPILVITSAKYKSNELNLICQKRDLKCLQQSINQIIPITGMEVSNTCISTIIGLKSFYEALQVITEFRG